MAAMVAHFRLAKQIVREGYMREDVQVDQVVQVGTLYKHGRLGIAN